MSGRAFQPALLARVFSRRIRLGIFALVAGGGATACLTDRLGSTQSPFGHTVLPHWLLLVMLTVTVATPYLAWRPTIVELSTPRCSTWFMAVPQLLASLISVCAGLAFHGTGLEGYYLCWAVSMLAVANLLVTLLGDAAWYVVFLCWVAVIACLSTARVDVYPETHTWLPTAVAAWLVTSVVLAALRTRFPLIQLERA